MLGPAACPEESRTTPEYVTQTLAAFAVAGATHDEVRNAAVTIGDISGQSSAIYSGPGLLLVDGKGRILNAWIGNISAERFEEAALVVREAQRRGDQILYMKTEVAQ